MTVNPNSRGFVRARGHDLRRGHPTVARAHACGPIMHKDWWRVTTRGEAHEGATGGTKVGRGR